MKKKICPGCHLECETIPDHEQFDGHGPAGTIRGKFASVLVSRCCGNEVAEIDADLHDWWLDLKKLAIEKGVEWLAGDPETHRDYFDQGDTVEDALDSEIDAAISSM